MNKDYVYQQLLNLKAQGKTFIGPALETVLSKEKPEKYLPVIVEIKHEEIKRTPFSIFISEFNLESASSYSHFPFVQGMVQKKNIKDILKNPVVVGVYLDRKLKNMVFAAESDKKTLRELKITKVKKVTLRETLTTMGVKELHDNGITGQGVKIAVLDTGANPEHPMIKPNLVEAISVHPDEIDAEAHNPHGPWCLSAAGGAYTVSDEYGEMFGAAPKASLYSIKVLDKTGSGAISTIIKGLDKAIDFGVDIISLSLGAVLSFGGTTPDCRAVDIANTVYNKNVVVAAGNSGLFLSIASPGDARRALTIGSVGYTQPWRFSPSMFSSKGPTLDRRVKPDFTAFGGDMYGNVMEMIVGAGAYDSEYEAEAGTSMATPQIAGIMALLHQLMKGDKRLGDKNFVENLLRPASVKPGFIPVKDILEGWGTPIVSNFVWR